MLPFFRPQLPATYPLIWSAKFLAALILVCFATFTAGTTHGMSEELLRSLREETIDLFYHGFDSYMTHAFPEDELKPVACRPLTRDRDNPAHIELNDALGNYSLTLIDSLSTLAILASSPDLQRKKREPLIDFQKGVVSLVNLYGDGSGGPRGKGTRGNGFDVDSKVQVFETVIRGVGGLLSAHLFAIGDLPIEGKSSPKKGSFFRAESSKTTKPPAQVAWPNDFKYDGQLLRLAEDLAKRLVPAFYTDTGLPYPRVNLRSGVPFYPNSPLNADAEHGICEVEASGPTEITETCSAGAGSLVLEFTTLSRLTGVPLYEELAKSAFWAVWERRSSIDLIGAGIDAESGDWVTSYTGIGAGIDSFFEYALKSYVLLSGADNAPESSVSDDFLDVWQIAHASIKRHLYRGPSHQSAHYVQGDVFTGAPKAFWMDSLSAYYPGLLTLAGELDEAIDTHMLFSALWTRYGAMPERWSTTNGVVDGGLQWWGGRPEFIESTWYLYQATNDPWYLFVGEMILRDIKRRCWTPCGWAGLEDVRSGELKDRMESFFLGETAKYLYLLFDPSHPLNKLDAPFVFSTEGHPLLLTHSTRTNHSQTKPYRPPKRDPLFLDNDPRSCPRAPPPQAFSISNAATRKNLFHAASLARLHQLPRPGNPEYRPAESQYNIESFSQAIINSRNNFTFFPWTLPPDLIPVNGMSARIAPRIAYDLSFPTFPDSISGASSLERVEEGVIVNSVSGLRMELIREIGSFDGQPPTDVLQVSQVGQVALGRDEKLFITSDAVADLSPTDPYFTRYQDTSVLDLILDGDDLPPSADNDEDEKLNSIIEAAANVSMGLTGLPMVDSKDQQSLLKMILNQLSSQYPFASILQGKDAAAGSEKAKELPTRPALPAMVGIGIGAGPLPNVPDATWTSEKPAASLPWTSIYFDDETCDHKLDQAVPGLHQVIVFRRGGCSFADKLENIPAFSPSQMSLQLVIIVSYPELEAFDAGPLSQPLLDRAQMVDGIRRNREIPVVMVAGGDRTMELLRQSKAMGIKRRYRYESQGYRILNLEVI